MNRLYAVQIRLRDGGDHVPMHSNGEPSSPKVSLAAAFVQSCRENWGRVAMVDHGYDLSYQWLLQQSCLIALHLRRQADFTAGMHVGLRLKNSPQYLAAYYGTLIAGGIVVPLPMHQKPLQIDRLCELADLRFIIEHTDSADDGELIRLDSMQQTAPEISPCGKHQLAMMLFTSGSSGDPKAVMLSHANLLANAHSILEFLPIEPHDRTLAIMPFSHALGNSVLQTHVLRGATLVFDDGTMFPSSLLQTLIRRRCSNLTAVPEVMQSLLLGLRDQKIKLDHLRYLAVAGGRLAADVAKELADRIAPAFLFLMYGQTEATARLTYLPPHQLMKNAGTVGRAIPGVQLVICDPAGKPVDAGTTGMLCARGDNIMLGYYKDAEATQQVLVDGWLRTGDLARATATGQIQICGRANNLIKTQGYRFHPLEVETMLAKSFPELQLVATPVDFLGHTRVALFAKREMDKPISIEQIQSVCRRVLPRHMMPQRVEIVDRWPLNGSNKIDRRALQAELEHRMIGDRVIEKTMNKNAGVEID